MSGILGSARQRAEIRKWKRELVAEEQNDRDLKCKKEQEKKLAGREAKVVEREKRLKRGKKMLAEGLEKLRADQEELRKNQEELRKIQEELEKGKNDTNDDDKDMYLDDQPNAPTCYYLADEACADDLPFAGSVAK